MFYLGRLLRKIRWTIKEKLRVLHHKIALLKVQELEGFIKLWMKVEKSKANYAITFRLDPVAFKHLTHFQYLPDIQFLEIGCFLGFTSNFLVDNFLQGCNLCLTCIDPWIDYSKSTENAIAGFDEIINNETFNLFNGNTSRNTEKISLHRGLSKDILPTIFTRCHFIFIDGDHSTSAVWKDAILSIPLLRRGGYILFDDYDWSEGKSNPKEAIDHFEFCFNDSIQHIPTYNNQRLYRLVREIDTEINCNLGIFD